jgi:hypothetical protein
MSQLGQSLQKSDVRVTSAYPSISDMIVQRQERRKGLCVDGSKLARRIFTSQAWSVHKKFLEGSAGEVLVGMSFPLIVYKATD